METIDCVAGVFLRRNTGCLLLMSARRKDASAHWKLNYLAHKTVSWRPSRPSEAIQKIQYLFEIVKLHKTKPRSVAVACYGPFGTPPKNDPCGLGRLHPKFSDLPFRGENLATIARSVLGESWGRNPTPGGTMLVVHTDANACALGEAYARNTAQTFEDKNHTLAFISCCEGVGLGLVRGRQIVATALHPEIGLIPPLVPISDAVEAVDFSTGIESFANDFGCLKRLARSTKKKRVSMSDLAAHKNAEFWNFRSYYLAQACLACTLISPPNAISISADIDPLGDVGARVQKYFHSILKSKRLHKRPIFDYEDIHSPTSTFISNSTPILASVIKDRQSATGAVGMCYAAASATEFGHLSKIR